VTTTYDAAATGNRISEALNAMTDVIHERGGAGEWLDGDRVTYQNAIEIVGSSDLLALYEAGLDLLALIDGSSDVSTWEAVEASAYFDLRDAVAVITTDIEYQESLRVY